MCITYVILFVYDLFRNYPMHLEISGLITIKFDYDSFRNSF